MKRVFAFFIAISLALALSGCSAASSIKPASTQSAIKPSQKEAKNTSSVDVAKQTEPVTGEPQIVFNGITAIDTDDCLLIITGIEESKIWGYTLKVYMENKTSDKKLRFTVESGAINGIECNPILSESVSAGKKTNDSIYFLDDSLENLLPAFTDIELELRVSDADNWMADDVAKETVHIYPFGKENATVYERKPQSSDTVIVDNESISIIVMGFGESDIWGYIAYVYLANNTDTTLRFSADDVSVNGFMCDPYWGTSVAPGKVAFSNIVWFNSSLEENGITTVDEIEMTFRARDSSDWSADDVFKETVKLKP